MQHPYTIVQLDTSRRVLIDSLGRVFREQYRRDPDAIPRSGTYVSKDDPQVPWDDESAALDNLTDFIEVYFQGLRNEVAGACLVEHAVSPGGEAFWDGQSDIPFGNDFDPDGDPG